jgi:hypothetical protein
MLSMLVSLGGRTMVQSRSLAQDVLHPDQVGAVVTQRPLDDGVG